MLMIDVRNSIADILERYSLGDVVEITLRKIRRDGLPAAIRSTAELPDQGWQEATPRRSTRWLPRSVT
jgi:hypothetical protein